MVRSGLPDDRRGQLLLVGGVALALVVVGTVVMLNGMKFQDTIGSKGNEQSLQDATRTEEMIRTDLSRLAAEVRQDAGLVDYGDTLARNISTYGGYYSNVTFDDGIVYVNTSLNRSASDDGRVVRQTWDGTGSPPDFTNNGGTSNWDVAREANTVRPFNVTIRQFPCKLTSLGTGAPANLTIRVENGSSSFWEVRLVSTNTISASCSPSQAGDRYIVVRNESGQIASFNEAPVWFPDDPSDDPPVAYDVRDGEVNGTEVADLEFAGEIEKPWTVRIETSVGDRGAGTFRLASDSDHPPTNSPSDTAPSIDATMAEPAVDIVYQRPELRYNSTIYLNRSTP